MSDGPHNRVDAISDAAMRLRREAELQTAPRNGFLSFVAHLKRTTSHAR
jgi:hypothetical protein